MSFCWPRWLLTLKAAGGAWMLAVARLNAARQVYGEARPVRLDFWRGWSQPRHQPLPARCCRLRRGRAWRRVVAPSRGAAQPRLQAGTARSMGDASPGPCSVLCATAVTFFEGTVPQGSGERAAPSLLEGPPSLWDPAQTLCTSMGGHAQVTPIPISPSSPPFWRCVTL